jgi:hypothetical protein
MRKNVTKDQHYNNITQYGFFNDPVRWLAMPSARPALTVSGHKDKHAN